MRPYGENDHIEQVSSIFVILRSSSSSPRNRRDLLRSDPRIPVPGLPSSNLGNLPKRV